MIILRQRVSSDFKESMLNWTRNLSPRFTINSIIFSTVAWVKSLAGRLRLLAGRFKHGDNKLGNQCEEHKLLGHHDISGLVKEKEFSNISKTFEEYCDLIPGYKSLAYLNNLNFKLLEGTSEELKKYIWTYFPSFFVLAKPDEIDQYREDYLSDPNPQDYAEILFMYGNELVFLWDFDKKSWYLLDKTYKPQKEWRIDGGKDGLRQALLKFCDSERDELLKRRIETIKSKEGSKAIRDYCSALIDLINKSFNY